MATQKPQKSKWNWLNYCGDDMKLNTAHTVDTLACLRPAEAGNNPFAA